MFRIMINGLATGLILQLAIGPVFLFIANAVIQSSLAGGLSAVAAVAMVDYLYILLAMAGVGKLLENKRYGKAFAAAGCAVLILFGASMMASAIFGNGAGEPAAVGMQGCAGYFIAAFLLTLSNPLTILFWTGLFTAKSAELKLQGKGLYAFGLSAGFSTILFLSLSAIVVSLVKRAIPLTAMNYLNALVGLLLIFYGIMRFIKTAKEKTS